MTIPNIPFTINENVTKAFLFIGMLLLAWFFFTPHVEAAITVQTGACQNNSTGAGTSLACTVSTANLDAGNYGVLMFAGDNIATGDDNSQLVTSVTDSKSNTWTVQRCFTNGQGGAALGATVCVATSLLTSTLTSGVDTITANFSSITAKAMVTKEVSVASGKVLVLTSSTDRADDGVDAGLMTLSGLSSADYLFLRSTADENRGVASWTVTPNYTTAGCSSTAAGGNDLNMTICGEYRIVTATTSAASDPTFLNTAFDNASTFMAFKELQLTFSGTIYADEGMTPITGVSKTLKLAIGTSTPTVLSTTTVSADGTYMFAPSSAISADTPLYVWVDGDVNARGAVVTKYSVDAISGLDIYYNKVIVRHEGASTITASNLSFYDADNDADIQFTANSGALIVKSGNELYVWGGATFAPTSTVTVQGNASSAYTDGSMHLGVGATYTAGATTTLAGNFTASSSATFTPTTSPLVFNATTTGKIINAPLTTLGPTVFNGSGGGWTFGTTSTTSNLTITTGTVVAPSTNLTITGDYTNSATFTHNSGTTTFNSTANQTATGTMTGTSAFNNLAFLGTGQKLFGANASTSGNFSASGADSGFQPITSIGNLGTANEYLLTSGDNTLPLTTTAAAEAGNLVIVSIAADNDSTTDGDFSEVSTITDSAGGNTWTKITEYTNGQLAAGGGATVSLWYSILQNTISSGGTITATFSAGKEAKAMGAWEFSTAGTQIITASSTFEVYDAVTANSMAITGLTSAEYLFVRAIAYEDRSQTLTPTANYTEFPSPEAVSDGGSQNPSMTAMGEFRIVTATGETSNPVVSGTGKDGSSIFVALQSYIPPLEVVSSQAFSIAGNYLSNSTIVSVGTTTFNGTSAQTLGGTLTTGTALFRGSGTKTFAGAATGTNITIEASSGAVVAPSTNLAILGNYTNNGTFTHNSGTVTFASTSATSTYTGVHFDTAASGNSVPRGIVFVDGYFWITDGSDAEVYQYTATGTYTGVHFDTEGSGNADLYGITYANGFFWTTDYTDGMLYQYTATGTYRGVRINTTASGAANPSGVTFAENFFWVADYQDSAVYKYAVDGSYANVVFSTAGSETFPINGITYANGYLWVGGFSNDNVSLYTLSGTFVRSIKMSTTTTGDSSLGLTIANGYLWTTDQSNAEVYQSSIGQVLSGTMTGTSAFNNLVFSGAASKGFGANASTTNLTIENTSGWVTAPSYGYLSIAGNYTNGTSSGFSHGWGTTTFNGAGAQTATGAMSGTNAFNHLTFSGAGTKALSTSASTTNFTIESSSGAVTAPQYLSVNGHFHNEGTFTAPSGNLSLSRSYVNNGTFTHNGGTVIATSTPWPSFTYASTSHDTVASGNSQPVAITYAEGFYWVIDQLDDEVYKYNYDGTYSGTSFDTAAAGSDNPVGIAYADGSFWIVDSTDDRVYKFTSAGTYSGTSFDIAASGAADSTSIEYAEGYLWVTDQLDDEVYKFTLTGTYTGTSFDTAASGNTQPYSIDYANGFFWILDASARYLYKFTTTGTYTGVRQYVTAEGGNTVFGVILVNDIQLQVHPGAGKVFQYTVNEESFSGNMTGTSAFNNLMFTPTEKRTILNNASTTNLTVNPTAFKVVSPTSGLLSVSGNYANSSLFITPATTTFSGTAPQTLSGNLTASSSLNAAIFTGAGTKTFSNNASTTNFTIQSGSGAVTAPTLLSIAGNYTNNGTFTANGGTTTFNGVSAQTATGTMSGTSAFATLIIDNTVPTTTFGAALTATQRFYASSSADIVLIFAAATTTNLNNATIVGSSTKEINLRSTTSGTQSLLDLDGTYTLTYLDVKDSNACPTSGTKITNSNIIDSGNNDCWTATLRISGSLYENEGSTLIASAKTIGIEVGTSSPSFHTTTSTAGGWSFTIPVGHTISSSTPILVWVDGDSTTRAAVLTKANSSTTAISNLDLYQNRVIIRHEAPSGTSTTLSDLAFYDRDNDSDIQYSVSAAGTGLTVNTNNQLYIWPGDTFSATGTVTINANASSTSSTDGSLHIASGAAFITTATTTIGGSFTASSSATYTSTSTLVMNATTTGKYLTVPVSTLGNVTLNGSGGGWTMGTTSTTSNLTITAGTLIAPSTNLTVTGNYSNAGTFTHNSGTVTFASTSATTTFTGFSFDTLASGNGDPYGITYTDSFFWVTDDADDEVYKYNLNGTYTGISFDTAASGNAAPRGMTYANDFFWVTDLTDDEVYKYNLNGTYTGISFDTLASGNGDPYSITYANGFFWIVDLNDKEVYKYNLNGTYTGISFDTLASGNGDPYGITYANGFFWITDYIDTEVYQYNFNGTYTGISFDTLASGADPLGIVYVNDFLWIVGWSNAEVYKYDVGNQTLSGNMFGTSAFNNLTFSGAVSKNFDVTSAASTSNVTIENTSGTVNGPAYLSISGNYSNATTTGFWHNWGTTTFNGTSPQTISGVATGTSAFNDIVFAGAGTKTFSSNASTTNFIIQSGSGAVTAPAQLSIAGNYANSGTFTANSGTTTFNGISAQTATGTLSGSSAFATLVLSNSATTTFGAAFTATQRFFASSTASNTLFFSPRATSTLTNATIRGNAANPIKLRSLTTGTQWLLDLPGAYTLTYLDVKDSDACPTSGSLITSTNVTDSGNNTCWISGVLLMGSLYEDEGNTLVASSKTIAIKVSTSTVSHYSVTSNAGSWNFTVPTGSLIGSSTPILVYVDGDSTTRAAVLTKAANSTANILGLNLYQNRIIIRQEGATTSTSTRLADMTFYDSDDDADIQYNASSTALTVNTNNKLYIWPNTTFRATGTVEVRGNASSTSQTDGSLHIATGATYLSTATTTLGGSFTASSTAAYISTSTLLFNATTTGKLVNAALTTLGTTTMNGIGGGWTFGTTSTTSTLTITNGTVVAPSSNLTITGNYTNNGTFSHNNGTTIFNSADAQTATGTMTGTSAFNNVTFTGARTKTLGASVAMSGNFSAMQGNAGDLQSIGTLGTATNIISGTTLALTTAATAEAGNLVILNIASDNINTTDGDLSEVTGITDSAGNTWTKLGEYTNGQGGAAAGTTVSFWLSKLVNTINTGDTITATFSGAITSKAMSSWEFSIGVNDVIEVASSSVLSSDGVLPTDMSLSGLSQGQYLFLRGIAYEVRTVTLNPTANYTKFTDVVADTGSDATSIESVGEFRIVSSTSTALSSPKGLTSKDSASIFLGVRVYTPDLNVSAQRPLSVAGNYTNNGNVFNAGDVWTPVSVAANSWQSVTYGNGTFVAVSSDGTNRVMTSPDGAIWTARSAVSAASWRSVTYGEGMYVAVAAGTSTLMTSLDGITWTPRTAPSSSSWTWVTYGNDRFVAVSYNGVAMYSLDGLTWATSTPSHSNLWWSVAFGNGTFVAVSSDGVGNNSVMTSTDGVTWTARVSAADYYWQAVAYGNGTFVAVACGLAGSCDSTSGSRVMTSPDGIAWTLRSPTVGNTISWTDVDFDNGMFVAVGSTGEVMTSSDGMSWMLHSGAEANSWQSTAYGSGRFVAVGLSGTNRAMISQDGTTTFNGTSGQIISGSLTGTSTLRGVAFSGSGTKTFANSASTTNFDIQSGSGAVTAPSGTLTIYGNYTNMGTFTHNSGTTTFAGTVPQTFSGTITGSSAFDDVILTERGTKTFASNASTSDLMIEAYAGAVTAPAYLSIGENYTNNSVFTHNSGTVIMAGASAPVAYAGVSFDTAASGNINPFALTYANGYFWSADPSGRVYKYTATGTYTGTSFDILASGNGTPRGITYANGFFWITDISDSLVYKYTATGTYTGVSFDTSAAGIAQAQGITYAEGYLYIGDTTGDVYKYTATGTYTGTSFTTNSSPASIRGITYANGFFWIVDLNGILYKYTLSGIYTGVSYDLTSSGLAASADITYANGYLWITDTTNDEVYKFSAGQVLSGSMTGTSSLNSIVFSGGAGKGFDGNASTSDFTIATSSGGVEAPSFGNLSIAGNYNNATTTGFGHGWGTTTFSGSSAQTITGFATGTSAFNDVVFRGAGTKTFASNASTTNFEIQSGSGAVSAPQLLSIYGGYSNSGTFTAGTGTTTLNGIDQQVMSGNMTGTSAFNNLTIVNTSANGSTSQAVRFAGSASTTGTFTMIASTSVQFAAGATTTIVDLSLQGSAGKYVWLRSSIPGNPWKLAVTGTQKFVSYVNVADSNACLGDTIIASSVTSYNGGGNSCWTFALPQATIASALNQTFALGNPTTAISPITVTENSESSSITAANDLRIRIATSTVRMLWDTTDTTATFGGTASAKVSNPVSYEGGGSVLVIPVGNDFAAGETLTVSGLSYTTFTATNTASSALGVYLDGAADASANNIDSKTVAITGSLTLANHSGGQVSDSFSFESDTNVPLYALRLAPVGETMTISSITFPLTGVHGVAQTDLTNLKLYRDNNSNGAYEAGDLQVGGSGALAMTDQTGTITFSTSWSATTTSNYLLVGDVTNVRPGDRIRIAMNGGNINATGDQVGVSVPLSGSVDEVQHIKNGTGAPGAIGGDVPDGVDRGGGTSQGGGEIDTNTNGTSLGNSPGFAAPTSTGVPNNQWTTPSNGYESDGSYAVGSQYITLLQSYGTFGFAIPATNVITGIEVKLEASGPSQPGEIEVALSWNNGTSLTTYKTTGTLTGTDAIYTLGSPSDTWGRSWTSAEAVDGSFQIVVRGTGGNTQIDAIRVRIYHQATGGGGGGGGEVRGPTTKFFASVPVPDSSQTTVFSALAWVLWQLAFM